MGTRVPTGVPTPGVTNSPTSFRLGSISGKVEEDVDTNDSGDVPISGVVIMLSDLVGAVIAITVTDTNGDYPFVDLPVELYVIT